MSDHTETAINYLEYASETEDVPLSAYLLAKAQVYALLDIADAIRSRSDSGNARTTETKENES